MGEQGEVAGRAGLGYGNVGGGEAGIEAGGFGGNCCWLDQAELPIGQVI